MFPFGKKSLEVRSTLHPDLQKLVDEVSKTVNCSLICGYRNKADQDKAFASGNSKLQWPKSRHNTWPSEAVDIVPWPVDWKDIKAFKAMAVKIKEAAEQVGVDIEWGGDWDKFKDYPHWQLKKQG